jgi:hypothetical protein
MAKRRTEAARVLAFFQSGNLEVAVTVLGLAQDAVKQRQPPRPAKVRRKKADGEAATDTGPIAMIERARQRKAMREAQAEAGSLDD